MPILKKNIGKLKLGLRKLGGIALGSLSFLFDFRALEGVNARGSALFDGSSTLSILDNEEFRTGDIDFTWAGWVYINTDALEIIIGKWNQDAGVNQAEYLLYYQGLGFDRYEFGVSSDGTGDAVSLVQSVDGSLLYDTWQFVRVWHDSVSNQIGIQIDDEIPVTTSHSGGVFISSQTLYFGTDGDSRFPYTGRMDNWGFWKRTLTSLEHDSLYNGGVGKSYQQLSSGEKLSMISWWELDELTDTRSDSHSNNDLTETGTIVGVEGIVEGPADELDPVFSWDSETTALEQATIANRPTFRTTYVDFDGSDDQLSYGTTGGLVSIHDSFVHFLKFSIDSFPSAGNHSVIYCEENDTATVQYRISINESGNIITDLKPSGASLSTLSGSSIVAETDYSISISRQQTSLKLFINGVLDEVATVDGGTTMTGAISRVGAPVFLTDSLYFNGRIYRMFLTDNILSDSEIATLSNQL
jgi:hypothetical protein